MFQAIKNDDINTFNALMEKAQCGAYRLGRFPVLSLMYLYNSRKLLSLYEEKFLKIASYEEFREPVEISKKFAPKAGKCLRLYLNETVSPLEMLLILDKTRRLKRVYPQTRPSAAVKERLKTIYSIKYSLSVRFEGDNIIIDKRPLSYREKKNIATVCLCSVLAVAVAVGVPVTVNAVIPKPVDGEAAKLSDIDFYSDKEYTLISDIVLPENYSVKNVNCKIVGKGKKMILGKGASLGELGGKISDLIIESSGSVIFTSVSENAVIENVTVNVSAEVSATTGTALVAETNYGTIDGVTVNVSGKISALATSAEASSELTFGGIVQHNDYKYGGRYIGLIKNCTVNYSEFSLVGEASANAACGGVAGINSGYLQNCTVNGKITADTFDIAGVCSVNNSLLAGNVNNAELSQTTEDTGWNPIACGIVLTNRSAVENCENRGKISSVSNCAQFEVQEGNEYISSAAGIAYLNRGTTTAAYIKNCANLGSVESGAKNRSAYAAGVCLSSSGAIESCKNSGAVEVKAENGNGVYAGGIATISYADISKSVSEGEILANGSGISYVGGISAISYALIQNCLSSGDLTVTARSVCAGGILALSDVTSDNVYIYCGTADRCISESKIKVTVTDDTPALVGGVVGCVRQARVIGDESVTYFGGRITNCYFTGECLQSVTYFGNIVGACGANVYESNSYVSGSTEYHNFENNYYLNNAFNALGTTVTDDGNFVSAEDKGATAATAEEIRNSEVYKSIKDAFDI